jgi:UDP-N-acetylglucosamine 1-carboxyvinyltransferase
MDQLVITGGVPLAGVVPISGAKNSALPILAASLLTEAPLTLGRVAALQDVLTHLELVAHLGVVVEDQGDEVVALNAHALAEPEAPYELVRTMRASFLVLGPLLARRGRARVSLPGGCALGARPVDQHLAGLKRLGAELEVRGGYVEASAPRGLRGARLVMDQVTVGGTEHLLMAAVCARGTTVLENAAEEPEIVDLAAFLRTLGAKIAGEGTARIEIEGVEALSVPPGAGPAHHIMADRIEAASYLIAGAATGGSVTAEGADSAHLGAVLDKLEEAGARVERGANRITVALEGRPRPVSLRTAPYPGFPTDVQAQFMALDCLATGVSRIRETVFENRFMHVPELARFGAQISLEDARSAVITGVPKLVGAPVMATDLRASFSLVIAALAAEGESVIDRLYHMDRGYAAMTEKLLGLGAQVNRRRAP